MENQEYRKLLTQEAIDSQKALDKSLLTLSAGEIALSVTVVVSIINLTSKKLLICAWIALFLSLVSQLLSHVFATKAISKSLSDLSSDVLVSKRNLHDWSVLIANIFSLLSFIIGSVIFLVFVIKNV